MANAMEKKMDAESRRRPCQICGRHIVTSVSKYGENVKVAHHGYQRPQGWGMQTASCPGARALPFTVSRDLLARYLKNNKKYREEFVKKIESFQANPPEKLTCKDWSGKESTYRRPENFVAGETNHYRYERDDLGEDYGARYEGVNYSKNHLNKTKSMKYDLRSMDAHIKSQQERYDAWEKLELENGERVSR